MSKNISFKRQVSAIKYMLLRKYPDVDFKLTQTVKWDRHERLQIGRAIIVTYNSKKAGVDQKEIEEFLKKFSDIPKTETEPGYARTYWMNSQDRVSLARVRALNPSGSTTLLDKFDPPEDEGPYTLERFSINSYEVVDTSKPQKRPYPVYDYD